MPFQNVISIWFEMRYHFSCFHNCFSEIVQNLSKSATFGMGSCNFQIKNVLLFQMGNNFHMIKKLFCTSLVYLRRSINHGRLFFIEAANSLRPLLVFMVFVIEGRNALIHQTRHSNEGGALLFYIALHQSG